MHLGKSIKVKLTRREAILTTVGFLSLLLAWQVASMNMHALILASPYQAVTTLWGIMKTPDFTHHFFTTLRRISAGLMIGGSVGIMLGFAVGLNKDLKCLLEPLRWLIMSVPPIVIVVLAMLWFGMGTTMVVFMVALMVAPAIYVNTYKGIEMVDRNLVEVSQLYKFTAVMRIRDVYLPAIIGPLSAAAIIVTCQAARTVVMAELLGAYAGIGYVIEEARSDLEIPTLFAWVLTSLAIVAFFEFVIFKPIHNYLVRWQR